MTDILDSEPNVEANHAGPSDEVIADDEIIREVPKSFSIDDEASANWLVKKIVAARHYAAHVKQWSEKEIRRAERDERTLTALFGRQLEEWTRAQVEALGGRRKSINLPAGIVGFRTAKPSLQVDDEQAVIRWAAEHCPSAVLAVQKLSRAELKTLFERTGAIPSEGAHIEAAAEKFFVR